MLFYTVGQGYVFLAALAAGAAIGLLYDALRGVRWLLEAGPWLNLAADVAFGIGAGAIAIGCVYFAAYGELRAYSLLGMLCGCIPVSYTHLRPLPGRKRAHPFPRCCAKRPYNRQNRR